MSIVKRKCGFDLGKGLLPFCLVAAVSAVATAGPLQKAAAKQVVGVDDWAMGVALVDKLLYCIAGPYLYALDVSEPLAQKSPNYITGAAKGILRR